MVCWILVEKLLRNLGGGAKSIREQKRLHACASTQYLAFQEAQSNAMQT